MREEPDVTLLVAGTGKIFCIMSPWPGISDAEEGKMPPALASPYSGSEAGDALAMFQLRTCVLPSRSNQRKLPSLSEKTMRPP